ncbi:MAG: hypothetical protein HY744_04230 [Deltaproteobacteria bacterium]|nr:hypothetical protein [Deltaproteobacteria bacterium]
MTPYDPMTGRPVGGHAPAPGPVPLHLRMRDVALGPVQGGIADQYHLVVGERDQLRGEVVDLRGRLDAGQQAWSQWTTDRDGQWHQRVQGVEADRDAARSQLDAYANEGRQLHEGAAQVREQARSERQTAWIHGLLACAVVFGGGWLLFLRGRP